MNNGASLGKNTLDLFTKWSEGHLGLLNQRQRMFKEATHSFLGIVQGFTGDEGPGGVCEKTLREHA